MSKDTAYSISPYPKLRRLIADVACEGKKINCIHGFGEFDLSHAREVTGRENISLISYLVHCTAISAREKPEFNSFKKGNRIVTFNEVDISLIFEVEIEGRKFPMNYIIRSADTKSLKEIDTEINNVRTSPVEKNFLSKEIRIFYNLPRLARKAIWSRIMANPFLIKKYLGTVGITALHTVNAGQFWGLPLSPLTLTLTYGGIYNKVVKIKDKYAGREFLNVTASVNHDMVDGGQAKRYFKLLKRKVENFSL
jgi:pyruvate/2-oxoglutarate dehydrogenase complex dihydrolipoamide acyltransferase (E2) component